MAERRMYQRIALMAVQKYLREIRAEDKLHVSSVNPVRGETLPSVYTDFYATLPGNNQLLVTVYPDKNQVVVVDYEADIRQYYSYDYNNSLTEIPG